jgi:hypothetical protein
MHHHRTVTITAKTVATPPHYYGQRVASAVSMMLYRNINLLKASPFILHVLSPVLTYCNRPCGSSTIQVASITRAFYVLRPNGQDCFPYIYFDIKPRLLGVSVGIQSCLQLDGQCFKNKLRMDRFLMFIHTFTLSMFCSEATCLYHKGTTTF